MHSLLRASLFFSLLSPALSEEGMWLFTHPPVRQVKEAYGHEITADWLEHLQKSSVRFGNGGSGSFASANGLILTNHHVGSGMIEKLSTPEKDLLAEGFYAAGLEQELKCPDLELNVLMSIEDVTTRVNAAVTPDQSPEQAAAARRAVIAEITRQSLGETGLRSDVVTLYQGGAYHLYRYHRYTDVRLVFAPDVKAAAFGGDPDNFEFPRYCLDFCFFRAYEDGKPAETPHFLKWNAAGAKDGELVYTSGHPGRTNRLITQAQLESMRDDGFPYRLEQLYRGEAMLRAWADRDRENARRAKGAITGTQNGRKALAARLDGLLDPQLMARKEALEAPLIEAAPDAFARIAAVEKEFRAGEVRLRMLEGGDAFGSGLFGIARALVRVAAEASVPEGERLEDYRESGRESLELDLFSPEPVYQDLEIVRMTGALTFLCAKLGVEDPLVMKILAGKSPRDRAAELVRGTGLADVALRRQIYDGGADAVAASEDPMIFLAKVVDAEARALRKAADARRETTSQAHREIAAARFTRDGDSTYPDATFTLRLSYGTVKGYTDGGQPIAPFTTLGGLFARSSAQGATPPFDVTAAWQEKVDALGQETPLNFVSTNDITGGNSGSPVVNREGELVGLIFDTNAPGLVSDFLYAGEKGRAVSVHPAAMLEVMEKVYGATRVLEELSR